MTIPTFVKRVFLAVFLLAAVSVNAQAADNDPVPGTAQLPPIVVENTTMTFETDHSLRTKAGEGDPEAQFSLGFLYAQGMGVKQDFSEALNWFRKAADQGHAAAQTDIGFFYAEGKGVKQDYQEAAKWFAKAAEKGDALAQFNLGFLYANGKGVKQSWEDAAKWYGKAAQQWKPQE
jgi:TPR repeat protein